MKSITCKTGLLIFFLSFLFVAKGQSNSSRIDSLKKALYNEKEDTNKVNTLDTLAYLYMRNQDIVSSISYAKQALPLSQKLMFKKGQGYSFFIFADYSLIQKDYQQSVKDCYTAIHFFKEAGFTRGIISVYYALEGNYFMLGNMPEANKICYEIIKYCDETGDKKNKAFVQMWLGFNYYEQEAYDQAFTTYSNALETYKQTGISSGSGQCYIYMANIYRIQKKYVEALHFDSVGLRIATADSDKQMIGNAYLCFGDVLAQQADSISFLYKNKNQPIAYKDALTNYTKSLDYARQVPDSGGMGDSYEHVAEMYIQLHQFDKAQRYADSALLMAKITNSNDNFEKSYMVQSQLDSATGNYKNAFAFYKKIHALS